MSSLRSGTPGATRVCPHCKATVLETAAICPGCRHHLRFSAEAGQSSVDEGYCALSVDGSIAHKQASEPCEYFIVLDIRDERGEQLARQVVGVGVLQPGSCGICMYRSACGRCGPRPRPDRSRRYRARPRPRSQPQPSRPQHRAERHCSPRPWSNRACNRDRLESPAVPDRPVAPVRAFAIFTSPEEPLSLGACGI